MFLGDSVTTFTALATDHDNWDGPGPWWPLIPLFWIAFFVLIFGVFGRFGRRRHRGSYAGESRLAERYATGEIDETEYRQRLAVLRERDK
jgi:putative membrane protein